MSSGGDGPYMIRLADLLAERHLPVEKMLVPVQVTGTAAVYVIASLRTRRLDLMLPYHRLVLDAVNCHVVPPVEPENGMLRLFIDSDALGVIVMDAGPRTPRALVDEVSPPNVRERWLEIVTQLCAVADGQISNWDRYLTDDRAFIAVRYRPREAATDAHLVTSIDRIAGRLSISEAQRALWRLAHANVGAQIPFSAGTQCSSAGPVPSLSLRYAIYDWERAVDLTKVLFDPDTTRQVAATLGRLAGTLQSNKLFALEIVLGPQVLPDIVVWARLRPRAGAG